MTPKKESQVATEVEEDIGQSPESSTEGVPEGEPSIPIDDVDDIIGIASELAEQDDQSLTLEEVEEVAEELDVPEEFVEEAVAELKSRREADAAREKAQREKARRVKKQILIAATLAVAASLVLAITGQSGLKAKLSLVEQAQSQLENVTARQVTVIDQWGDRADSNERDAELSGAENRVRIEQRRYDEAAAEYNASAGSVLGRLWSGLFGLPSQVPLSNQFEAEP